MAVGGEMQGRPSRRRRADSKSAPESSRSSYDSPRRGRWPIIVPRGLPPPSPFASGAAPCLINRAARSGSSSKVHWRRVEVRVHTQRSPEQRGRRRGQAERRPLCRGSPPEAMPLQCSGVSYRNRPCDFNVKAHVAPAGILTTWHGSGLWAAATCKGRSSPYSVSGRSDLGTVETAVPENSWLELATRCPPTMQRGDAKAVPGLQVGVRTLFKD